MDNFYTIRFKRKTARRFKHFSKKVAKSYSETMEMVINFFEWHGFSPSDRFERSLLQEIIKNRKRTEAKALCKFLSADLTAKAMADAFISGVGSDRQTAGVKSTLANAFKKISTKKIFMVLSEDDIPLDINNPEHPAIISIVNNPKKEASLSPVIASIMHTITKQMSERSQSPSFVLLEEASTIRLLNMHRIPATLRSYDTVTVYVLHDKIQNDMMYGDKASKAILSNLSYQFFGKANDPDTAKYYERFFEIVKKPTKSISKSSGLSWESRITKGEKEVAKTRADAFYGLKQGEFIVFADGEDKRLRFKLPKIKRELPSSKIITQKGFGS